MNREIEFRGVSKSTGNFVYGTLINYRDKEYYILTDDQINYGLDFDFLDCCEVIQVYPESVGQYTGLKDKNGVKIFEGDVFIDKDDGCIGVVRYSEQFAWFIIEWYENSHSKEPLDDDPLGHINIHNMEIIGNIYENPELLEVQDE